MNDYPKVVEIISFENLLDIKKEQLNKSLPNVYATLEDKDPAISVLKINTLTELGLAKAINFGLQNVMLDFTKGEYLEALGKLFGINGKKIIKQENADGLKMDILESEDDFRQRVLEAPKGLSGAGSRSSYVFHSKMASPMVKDVSALYNSPGCVDVYLLSYEGNGTPTEHTKLEVKKYLNGEKCNPVADEVNVLSANIIEYSISVKIAFVMELSAEEEKIILNHTKSTLEAYTQKQHKFGKQISKEIIIGLVAIDKRILVKEVDIHLPSKHTRFAKSSIAYYCKDIGLFCVGY